MPDRAIPPLIAGVTFGFIAGLIAAVLQLDDGPTMLLALVCGALAAGAGLGSTLTADAEDEGDKRRVALLRAALGGVLAILIIFAMTSFLRDGNILLGLVLLVLAGLVGLPLAQLRVRTASR